jgi:purine-binding chemotaxis protein CheW
MRAAVTQIVVLRCGEVHLGVPIDRVREIVLVPDIAPVPESGEVIRGIINLRGRILPVLDLGHRLGVSSAPRDRSGRIVVVEQDAQHLLGLLVDEASEVLRIPEGSVSPTPELAGIVLGAGVRNVARCDDRLILLVDLEVVLAFDGSRPARREASA